MPPLKGEGDREAVEGCYPAVYSSYQYDAISRRWHPSVSFADSILEWSRDFIELSPGQFDPHRGAVVLRKPGPLFIYFVKP